MNLSLVAFLSLATVAFAPQPPCKEPGRSCGGQSGRCCTAGSSCDTAGFCTYPANSCECIVPPATITSATCNTMNGGGSPRRCNAKLSRNPGYVTVEIDSLQNFEEGHAYTIWFGSCPGSNAGCSGALSPTNGEFQLYNLGGFVHGSAITPLKYLLADDIAGGVCPSNQTTAPTSGCAGGECDGITIDLTQDLTEPCITYDVNDACRIIYPLESTLVVQGKGLKNAMTDTITLWFKDHGLHDSSKYFGDENQLRTFNGGCTLETIHKPKAACPDDNAGFDCWDVANINFGPP